jgi:hypothetical protein
MERMGHNSTRAALIYLHASRAGDRRIADGIGRQLAGDDGEDQGDRTAATGRPGGQLGRDLAWIWHEGRSGAQSADHVESPASPLTWCGAGDGNRTRIVSLGRPVGVQHDQDLP